MRIGERLLAAGLLTRAQIAETLRAQMLWGGRFGTNAVELGYLDLDPLTRVLAAQRELPGAYASHFERADPEIQRRLSPELAAAYACIPLRYVGAERAVLASIAPLPGKGRALVAHALGISHRGIIPAIAAELRIYYHLELAYDLPRPARFLRPKKRSTVPSLDIDLSAFDDSEQEVAIPTPVEEESSSTPISSEPLDIPAELPEFAPIAHVEAVSERRRDVRSLCDGDVPRSALGRISLRRRPSSGSPGTLAEATRAIRRAADRDAVASGVIEAVARFVPSRAAALLVVRQSDAIGWAGYRADGEKIPDLVIPLDEPGAISRVVRDRAITRTPAGGLARLDALLLRALGQPECDLVIAPVAIGDHVWCVLALAATSEPGTARTREDAVALEAINGAASRAFARLLRMANR